MRKAFFWAVTAFALLPGVVERANAQATGAADVAADASVTADGQSVAESATGAADAATDSVSEAATGQSDATSASATSEATPQAPSTDANASIDANANVDANADPNAAEGANAKIDAGAANNSARAQANLNAQPSAQNISAGLQFGQATQQGLTLRGVANDSFLYRSGLRQGDVLVTYAGRPIRSQEEFNRWAVYQSGQRVPVVVWRDGREETLYVTYDQQQPIQRHAGYAPQTGGAYLGLTFDPQSDRGALVRSVAPGSPAAKGGVAPGHLIVGINGQPISHYQEIIDHVASLQPGQQIDLMVAHHVTLGARSGQAAATPTRVESSVVPQTPPVVTQTPPVGVPTAVLPATPVEPRPVVRPGDADRDGRVLDGDGRIGPLERAGRR